MKEKLNHDEFHYYVSTQNRPTSNVRPTERETQPERHGGTRALERARWNEDESERMIRLDLF